MLSDIIKQAGDWDTKVLAEIFSDKKFLRSVDGDKEKYKNYLIDLVSESFGYQGNTVTLPREIIPDSLTLDALCFTHKKDPSTLPILLRYFTHKNLLKEAKDDLDKINQELQSVMDKDLTDLQGKQKELQKDKARLNNVEMRSKEAKALAIDKIDEQITETSFKIKEIESCREDTKNLLNGGKVKLRSYPFQYFSILNSGLIEIMEKKLTAYVKDNKDNIDIEKTYQSLNSRAKRIIMLRNIQQFFGSIFFIPLLVSLVIELMVGMETSIIRNLSLTSCFIYFAVIPCSIAATLFATAGVAYLVKRHYEQSFAKEMQDFIEGPKYVDKATNTEDVKKLEQEETEVGGLIDFSSNYETGVKSSAPPCDEPKQPADLSEVQQPPSYEEACSTVQPKDSQPSSNLDSAEPEQPKLVMDLLESLPEQLNAKLGPVLLPSNTM